MNTIMNAANLGLGLKSLLGATMIAVAAISANAGTITSVDQALNTFTDPTFTGGAETIFDQRGAAPLGAGPEVSMLGGIYDVDVTTDSLTMTFNRPDLSGLGVFVYGPGTIDGYYFEFDQAIAGASILSQSAGFGASVEVLSVGTSLAFPDLFATGLQTDYTFDNGGILVRFGEGTNLNTLFNGGNDPRGSITIGLSAVPIPASLPLLLAGFGALALTRRGTARAS